MKLPARIFTKGTRRGKNDLTYLIAWEGDFGHVSALDLGAFRSEYIVSEWLDTPKYRHAKGDDHEAIDSYNRDGRPMVHLVGVEYRGKVVASVGIGSEHAMMTAAELLRDDQLPLKVSHVFHYNGQRGRDRGRTPSGAGIRGRDRGRSGSGHGNAGLTLEEFETVAYMRSSYMTVAYMSSCVHTFRRCNARTLRRSCPMSVANRRSCF